MGKALLTTSPCIRRHLSKTATRYHRQLSTQATRPVTLTPSPVELTDLGKFREHAFKPQKPFLFGRNASSPAASLPAARKWFDSSSTTSAKFSEYMTQFQEWPFPYELVTPSLPNKEALVAFHAWLSSTEEPADQLLAGILEPSIVELESRSFFQLFAPLRLLLKALEFNQAQPPEQPEPVELYIAQSSLADLPQSLQEDLPTPELVQRAGKGDVYSSSIWLGTEPTYTPLHRDPNPNVFCQLCSSKVIRLMAPAKGDRLYFEVQARIRQQGNSRIRNVEMMEGKEREALHEAVWGQDGLPNGLYEAALGPGDSLFIPNGWWHSVKSKGSSGHLNGSVNWWFR
ncbi:hypothetical protein NM208_g16996 [Fusarium decemcellulare]|uniref:Uncharacterized protein n=1 Tax=Fusarium decemcellulare TaxID=57161 RepID=A0ACC1RAH6_9HYPO|nr:hypothetical protein NM208_g16996 [Fusarium decemcellulare]